MKVKMSKYLNAGRKIAVHIDHYDLWSLDTSLAYIIYPALLELRMMKHGVPADFANVGGEDWNEQGCFDFYKETHDWAFNEKIKEWDEIMDKMIWSFQQLIWDNEESFHYGKIGKFKVVKTGQTMLNPVTNQVEELSQIVDPDPTSHYFDVDGYNIYQERIQEGLDLFAKYYRSLWD